MKFTALEVPPPGPGLTTLTAAAPGSRMSPAGIAACNWLWLAKVVGRGEPFQFNSELNTKLDPFTVKVKPNPSSTTPGGDKLVIVGNGFRMFMVNVRAFDVPPPGAGLKTGWQTSSQRPGALHPTSRAAMQAQAFWREGS